MDTLKAGSNGDRRLFSGIARLTGDHLGHQYVDRRKRAIGG